MLPIVCWAAKPMIAARTAVEARMPAASRLNSVNWLRASAIRTTKTISRTSRRRKRSRVLVERDTCETAGDMDATVSANPAVPKPSFPFATWGPWTGVLGVLLALGTGIVLSIPVVVASPPVDGELTDTANALVQLATALGFLLVPIAIAAVR